MIEIGKKINDKIMSAHFKTSHTFKWQPISLSVLVDAYIKHFRPGAQCDEIFVTTKGTPVAQGMINKGRMLDLFCLT